MNRAAPRYTRIAGTGSYLPPRRLSNADLVRQLGEKGIETSDEWIVERTGIRARHFVDDGVNASHLALHAARHALEAASCRAEDIDLIIVATSTPDMVFPSTACIVQRELGVHGCPAFDVQAVCSGFVYALTVADSMIRTGAAQPGAGHRRGGVLAHSRFQRPRHLRALRRRCRRGGAQGQRHARHPGQRAARRRPPCRHPVRAGHGLGRQGARRSAAQDGRPGGVQAGGGRARQRGARRAREMRPQHRSNSTG